MRIPIFVALVLCSTITLAQTPSEKLHKAQQDESSASSGTSLPVHKVVLYKNGVGYFEHAGRVYGNQDLGIEFTTAQLNDVLKSLTLVDLNGGSIGSVRYNSVAPLDEQLKGLQIPLSEDVTSAAFLIALRGTRVEVRDGITTAIGKIFSIETLQKENPKGEPITSTQLAIVTDAGEMRLFEMKPGIIVRAADREIQKELNRYLTLVGSTRSKDIRRMNISASGSGERNLVVSYISEVPVWKSTYRIVLPKAPAKPFLQGWAIVDNTVGEDWKDVKLSLVSGTPQSFIQNISQPYYTRRPVVELPESVMLTPQAHEASQESPSYGKIATTLTSPKSIETGMGSGGGTGGGSFRAAGSGGLLSAPAPPPPPHTTDETEETDVSALLSQDQVAVEGTKVGDLFEYHLKEKITVLKNQSALVPIVQSPIEAEKVTLITTDDNRNLNDVPLRAVWMRNTSGLTLDGGTFNVLEEASFAGEGILDVLHPDERRLLSYAVDKSIRVSRGDASGSHRVTRTTVSQGVMTIHREDREEAVYVLHNSDNFPRQLVLEHPLRSGWHLADTLHPEETSLTRYRFRVPIDPGATIKFAITEFHPVVSRVTISTISEPQLLSYAFEGAIDSTLQEEIRKIIFKRSQISDLDQEFQAHQQELQSIDKDQARLRENMKALKGSPEERTLLQRYTKELDSQEDHLAELQKKLNDLKLNKAKLQVELDEMLQAITLDVTH